MSILQKLLSKDTRAKRFFTLSILSTLIVVCFSLGANGQERYVSTTGVNAGTCDLPGSPCLTIQYAVNQAVAGDNVNVAAGSYAENVLINKSLSLLGTGATVTGSYTAGGPLGTFFIPTGINGVSIDGFTLIGYDSPDPGVEQAVIYLAGNHDGIAITNNIITAAGEGGLLEEFGGASTNFTITNNTFNGKTFVGAEAAGCGFGLQFSLFNVPRQLVVINGSSDMNITFTDNVIDGITGSTSSEVGCTIDGQGNTQVTIDATNATISGNVFSGVTARFATLLRTRGTANSIFDNDFDATNLLGTAYFHFYDSDALTGGTPSDVPGLIANNDYTPDATFAVDGSGNVYIIICNNPILNATINSLSTSSIGTDRARFAVCSGVTDNITFGSFTNAALPAMTNVKVYQAFTTTNASAGTICNNCSAPIAAFNGATATFSTINPLAPGAVNLMFIAYADLNDNNIREDFECQSDTVFYTVTFDVTPPSLTCPADVSVTAPMNTCAGIATFTAPVGSDTCPGIVTVTQVGGPTSGSSFNIGSTLITYMATDAAGNTASCTFNVIVSEAATPPLGCIPVNISLDGDCEGELTPTSVLTGWQGPGGAVLLGCPDNYVINVVGTNGQNLGNTVSGGQLNKTLNYSITNAATGFSCWNTVLVEDKYAPTIECVATVDVACLEDLSLVALPVPYDNCQGVKAVLVNEEFENLSCNLRYVGTLTRQYKAVDAGGRESAICTTVINILRPSVVGVTLTPINPKLSCSTNFAKDSKGLGYPAPSVTGLPMLGTKALFPMSNLETVYCNAVIDYTDQLIIDTGCKKRITRTWAITEWYCGTAVELYIGVQVIDIVDDIAPVIPQQLNLSVSTQSRSCSGSVTLPFLAITDNCNAVRTTTINVTNDGTPVGYLATNGGKMDMPVGVNVVTYTSTDACGNASFMTYNILVADKTDPVAICDQFATISLKTNGYTEVTASAIDNGSRDECGPVTLKVRRMEDPCNFGADTSWYDKVGFCCLDANTTRMVQLLVTDKGGNTNMCMVSVNIQDKVNPTMTCPLDISINNCEFVFDAANPDDYFGKAVISDNCPANNTIVQSLVDNRTACGLGTVVRTMSLQQGTTVFQTCTQTITFMNDIPFDGEEDIEWPADLTITGACSYDGLDPSTLPIINAFPIITKDRCDMIGMNYEDEVYQFTENGACYKIIRNWKVIDWCQTDRQGNSLVWTYEQEFKVEDKTAPVITSSTNPVLVCTFDSQCADGLIQLTASATDCTPAAELLWNYTVTRGGVLYARGAGNDASGTYPVGKYNVRYEVEDRCGNISSTAYDFEIRSCKAPTARCKPLATSVTLMDTDGDGTGDTPLVMVTPTLFDNKSDHACGYPLTFSFSADPLDVLRTFGCADIGVQTIQMWVTDVNGNTSFCETQLTVEDLDGLCGTPLLPTISGRTVKQDNKEITNVTVELEGSEQVPVLTNIAGRYAFQPINTGGNYAVTPHKDGDYMNGISTLDVVMIQRHILDVEKLKSPYDLIAADVNNSGKITAADLIELRKVILGLSDKFTNNTSWRFIDAAHKFIDAKDPWLGSFPEKYSITPLMASMDVNFIGLKVGDVDGNAVGNNANDANASTRSKFMATIEDINLTKGDIVNVSVMASSSSTIYGLQAQFESKGLIIRNITSGQLQVASSDYALTTYDRLGLSLANASGSMVNAGEAMFNLEVEALASGSLSSMLSLGNQLGAEVYTGDNLETSSFGINWRSKSSNSFLSLGNQPNPWTSTTSVGFNLPSAGAVTINIMDITGQKVKTIVDNFEAGTQSILINKSDLRGAGVYFYELKYESTTLLGKMIMIE